MAIFSPRTTRYATLSIPIAGVSITYGTLSGIDDVLPIRIVYLHLDVGSSDWFKYFKRIGDLCLFLSGICGTDMYVQADTGGRNRNNPQWVRKIERSLEDYEYEGKTFYKLAREHPTSSLLGLSEGFHKSGEFF